MTEKKVELTVLVNKLSEKINAINIHNSTPPSASVPESQSDSRSRPFQDCGIPDNDIDHAACSTIDVTQEFERVRDKLNRVSLPSSYKVHDSAAGIKQDCKPALKVISRCARFAETGLKQLSTFERDDNGMFCLSSSDDEVQSLFTIFAAQSSFLKAEYSSLVVKSSFSAETSRLFRAFENNTSTFSESSLRNMRVAAELSSLSSLSSAHSQPTVVISGGGVTTAVALDCGTEQHSEVVSHQILWISPLDEKPTIIN
ncbi:hypothetical protein RRG08_007266 [Elysia crispata]|uniref:Uncharacterized protein n=1 Tax=Elysia crispata TaxID=231223 RepID=A0AAE0ZSQ6_9GAST|nr:hypothetical protein RRG08_007266 [Elysia crispata]